MEAKNLEEWLNEKLLKHTHREEEIVFPFVAEHIPKFEPIIRLLQADHHEIERNLKLIHECIAEIFEEQSDFRRRPLIDKLQETCLYLKYLLRNYILIEKVSIRRAIEKELRPEEKKALRGRWAERGRRGSGNLVRVIRG